VNYLNTAE
jgi:kinesin family member C1